MEVFHFEWDRGFIGPSEKDHKGFFGVANVFGVAEESEVTLENAYDLWTPTRISNLHEFR